MEQKKLQIAIISGTNRMGSYSMKVSMNLKTIIERLGQNTSLLDLSRLPLEIFHSDSYGEKPKEFASWQTTVSISDALCFCTPEYNGGVPGILKYFLDMLEYPDSISQKPVMLLGLSAGNSGAANALEELSRLLRFQKASVFNHTVSIAKCLSVINEVGALNRDLLEHITTKTNDFLYFCSSSHGLQSSLSLPVI